MTLHPAASTTGASVPGRVLDVLGPRIQHLTPLAGGDDAYCLMRGEIPPGVVVPLHSHADRETFVVLSGQVEVWLKDGWRSLHAGEVCDVQGGLRHAWRNASGTAVAMLIVTTVRLGRFMQEIGRPAASAPPGPPAPAELERLVRLSQDYGYWVGRPDDNAAVGLSLA